MKPHSGLIHFKCTVDLGDPFGFHSYVIDRGLILPADPKAITSLARLVLKSHRRRLFLVVGDVRIYCETVQICYSADTRNLLLPHL